jgi:hypothetical protein
VPASRLAKGAVKALNDPVNWMLMRYIPLSRCKKMALKNQAMPFSQPFELRSLEMRASEKDM